MFRRVESIVTRILLLGTFVTGIAAQFVKPLGDALQGNTYIGGALLSLVGYILYSEVQRLNTTQEAQQEALHHLNEEISLLNDEARQLRDSQRLHTGEQVTSEELIARFREALESTDEVHFEAVGFTGETFSVPLKQLLWQLPQNPRRSVSIRVLVPDFTKSIEVPGLVQQDGKVTDAPGFRQHLLEMTKSHEASLKSLITRMADAGKGALSVEFRAIHMSPSLKLYIINSEQVLEGVYDKIELHPDVHSLGLSQVETQTNGMLLDPVGYDTVLTSWHQDDGPRAQQVIHRRVELFNTFWTAAHELSSRSLSSPRNPQAAG